jgi:hypothetical protein
MSDPSLRWFVSARVTHDDQPPLKVSEYVRIAEPSSGRTWLGEVMFAPVSQGDANPGDGGESVTVEVVLLLEVRDGRCQLVSTGAPTGELLARRASPEETSLIQNMTEVARLPLIAHLARMRASAEGKVKGFAHTLLQEPWISGQLRQTYHFGSLVGTPALEPIGRLLSRYDYVVLHCALVLDAKLKWPGAGLSSVTEVTYGVEKKPLTGLEVCQSWTILLNLGHLFGTFASERALFWQMEADRDLRRKILARIGSFNSQQLQRQCEQELYQSDLHHLFYVLAAWRICDATPAIRETGLSLIKMFLGEPRDQYMRRLRWIFKFSRQVAYNAIHSCMSGGVSTDVLLQRSITELPARDPIIFDDHTDEDIPLASLLNACDAYHGDATFVSAEAASSVLTHIRAFKKWWNLRDEQGDTNVQRLERLFLRPDDWPVITEGDLRHFVRLRLIGGHTEWLAHVRNWYGDDRWGTANFLISPSPGQRGLICDVYAGSDGLSANTICHMAKLLAKDSELSWRTDRPTEVERKLWRSVAHFGARLFEDVLLEEFHLRLDPVNAKDGPSNYAILAPDFETGRARLIKLMLLIRGDEERARELDNMIDVSEKLISPDRPWLVFLARTKIVGEGRDVADIDGLCAQFFDDHIEWTVFEFKVPKQGGASGQLKEKTLSCVRYEYDEPKSEDGTHYKCAYSKIRTKNPIMMRKIAPVEQAPTTECSCC